MKKEDLEYFIGLSTEDEPTGAPGGNPDPVDLLQSAIDKHSAEINIMRSGADDIGKEIADIKSKIVDLEHQISQNGGDLNAGEQ